MVCDLVFEGGGVKGVAFIGALAALESADIQPKRLLGSSAGAIMATLVAAGYRSDQLYRAFTERADDGSLKMATFTDPPGPFSAETLKNSSWASILQAIDVPLVPESAEQRVDHMILSGLTKIPGVKQLFSLVEMGGMYAGDAFLLWMQTQLDDMDGLGKATLADMYEHTEVELTVTAADVTDRRLMILNHRTAPKLPVAMAVRMSMSAPFYWQEVTWDAAWGTYRGNDVTGHAIVDGGVLANFPIELLLSSKQFVIDIMGSPSNQVIGLLLDDEIPVPNQPVLSTTIRTPSRLLNRSIDLIEMLMQADAKDILEAYADKVIHLPAGGYRSFDFRLDSSRLNALIDAGEAATARYLATAPSIRPIDARSIISDTHQIDAIAAKWLGESATFKQEEPNAVQRATN